MNVYPHKPLKGVISDWHEEDSMIVGTCLYHPEAQAVMTAASLFCDELVLGKGMRTSRVISLDDKGAVTICETENSIYLLVNSHEGSKADA